MYWFDTTIVALLIMAALLGARTGFVGQIARTLCTVVAVYAAILFHEPCMQLMLKEALRGVNTQVAEVLAYGVVFVVTYLVLVRVVWLVREGVQGSDLDIFDRVLGALLGTAKMAVVIGALCLGIANTRNQATETIMTRSTLATQFADGMERLVAMIPEEYKTYLGEKVQELREQMTRGEPGRKE